MSSALHEVRWIIDSLMPTIQDSLGKAIWILGKAGRCVKKNAQYYYAHPREAWEDLKTYAQENPVEFTLMVLLIIGGILTIAIPPALGFGAAGIGAGTIAAGLQAGIGNVVAGSAFAIMTSMGMTGAFAAIGGSMIAVGLQTPLLGWLLRRLRSLIADIPTGLAQLGILPNSPMLRRVFQQITSSDSIIRGTNRPYPGPRWFLDPMHMTIEEQASPSFGSSTALIDRRIIITNSKETYDMVWEDLDVATNSRTINEHAVLGFHVAIQLIRPQRRRGEVGFYEKFEDHDAHCIPGCYCVGDIE